MPREATLFDSVDGDPVEGFLLIRKDGGNIPPMWIERAEVSRRAVEKKLATELKAGKLSVIDTLRDWELKLRKENFYYGMRVLLELERNGKTKL